jgi:hypothetical protein
MKEYIVIANYYGECCTKAHLLVARLKAKSPAAARARLVKYVQDIEGNKPGEVLALPIPGDIPTLEEIQEEFLRSDER